MDLLFALLMCIGGIEIEIGIGIGHWNWTLDIAIVAALGISLKNVA